MDVETMMKINALSRELQKHGIAINSVDAVRQARVVVEETPVTTGGQECVLMQEVPEQTKPSPLQERRFELLFEMNNRKYDQELNALKTALSSMSTQLEQMRLELKTMNERQLQMPVQKKIDKQEMLKTEVKEAHPRQGNFTSNDVAIEKVFYFGTGGSKI